VQLYEIIGVDPKKSVIAKYNDIYVQLDYLYPDTITYNGAICQAGYPTTGVTIKNSEINGIRIIKGRGIGKAGTYTVYAIKQIDPSIAIIAYMTGSAPAAGIDSMSETITFFRAQLDTVRYK